MARTLLTLAALTAALGCRVPTPTPVGSTGPSGPSSPGAAPETDLRALSRDLQTLAGGEVEEHVAGNVLESRGPVEQPLGSSMFGRNSPRPEEIDLAFGRHCRPKGNPSREKTSEGYTRITYRGIARRSGGECTLITDLGVDGRWRFVLRIRRGEARL